MTLQDSYLTKYVTLEHSNTLEARYSMLSYKISAPNGIRASFASLNCCKPKGIPITVMQSKSPIVKCSNARGRPDTSSHIIFIKNEHAPPPYIICFPKGKKLSDASLKHWIPTGIPIIVAHQRHPARHQLKPLIAPPQTNQIKFPDIPYKHLPSYYCFYPVSFPAPSSVSISSTLRIAVCTLSLVSLILD